jgi:hypothetical protein
MIVFDLECEHSHTFEGWFGSSSEFDDQLGRGLVQCPICDTKQVAKKLSAPRINLGAIEHVHQSARVENEQGASQPATTPNKLPSTQLASKLSPEAAQTMQKMQELWIEMAKHVVANTEDVGSSFAEEARKIHYKEAPDRNIRGVTSADDAAALREEGIDVHAFPLPAALKGPLQ